MRIKISADSTCDLTKELVQQYDIEIIPLYVNKDGVSYKDGVDITAQDIFAHVSAGGSMCSTAAVNVEDYFQFFSRLRQEHENVIHFTISSSMSSSYQNACIAAEDVGGVYVVDAENLSTGIGQLVLEAAIMAKGDQAPEAVVAELNEMKKKLNVSFILDTLEYLRKGGRCSAVAALGANLLSLKPCIEVHDGSMKVGKKYRGSLDKCLEKYIKDRLADVNTLDLRRIFITHSGMDQARVDRVQAWVQECAPFAEILQTTAGCTISSHCGPNCLGVLFFNK